FAAELLTRVVAANAKESSVAIGGMTNVTHIGRLGEWGELGNELGVISFLCMGWAGGTADIAAPYGGAEPRVGTLPFTFGAPAAENDGMLIDMATTASAEGKVRVYRDKGLKVPDGWLLDQDGRPTNDPAKLYEGGMLVPFGGHKGYAVGLMVSLLGANLVGTAVEGGENPAGGFALAIDPGAFGDAEDVRRGIRANLQRLRNTRPAPGFTEVQVPGDFERASCRDLAGQPLDIPDSTWELYLDSAEKVGVSAEEVNALASGAG
ncbi:MAG: Ldh family oxidoreductase, partial [Chloroflexota bacterium]|nr:Ldh family oxidoreductase [Chloroflexota bacterium]